MKLKIEEVVVVEGRDDISAVKCAVDAEVIAVHGFSVRKAQNLLRLEKAYLNKGLIILTDPDYAGEQIRRTILSKFPDSKNAYIVKEEGMKGGDIGVENAAPESIIRALENAKCTVSIDDQQKEEFTTEDLIQWGLNGGPGSKEKRERLGKILSIGYSNSKQLASKLNRYGITREEVIEALEKI